MYTDLPVLRRCCFCFPLRPGLIAWVYIKMVTNMLFLGFLSYYLHQFLGISWYLGNPPIPSLCLLLFYILLDLASGVIFLVSAHKKKYKLMKIYYKYCMWMLIFHILCVLYFLFYIAIVAGSDRTHSPRYYDFMDFLISYVGSTLFIWFDTILLVYMILLVRSEMIKLESSLEGRLERSTVARDNTDGTTKEMHTAFHNQLQNEPQLSYYSATLVTSTERSLCDV